MLLRRCDVTVQSFLRRAKAKGDGTDGTTSSLPPPLEVGVVVLHARTASCFEDPPTVCVSWSDFELLWRVAPCCSSDNFRVRVSYSWFHGLCARDNPQPAFAARDRKMDH